MTRGSFMDFWKNTLNNARFIVAPMVDQSELAWRMLSRKHGAQLCYTPMLHSRIFLSSKSYRMKNFTTCPEDRPLIAQFCGDDPETILEAAKLIQNEVDAIDINLGCPQNIAKKGHYGAYLQDEWQLIESIVKRMKEGLEVPVTCKIRIFPEVEKSIKYAKMLQMAGCSLLTVHGRTRDQKGQNTGLADWNQIKAIRESLSIPVIANGNILNLQDLERCIKETGAVGVMSAEGNLYNPAIFEDRIPWIHEMIREYVEMVKKYDTPLSFVRGHLFKLFRSALSISTPPDLIQYRESLGKVGNLDKCLELALELAQKLQKLSEDDHFLETDKLKRVPYVRPLIPNENKLSSKDNDCKIDHVKEKEKKENDTTIEKETNEEWEMKEPQRKIIKAK